PARLSLGGSKTSGGIRTCFRRLSKRYVTEATPRPFSTWLAQSLMATPTSIRRAVGVTIAIHEKPKGRRIDCRACLQAHSIRSCAGSREHKDARHCHPCLCRPGCDETGKRCTTEASG